MINNTPIVDNSLLYIPEPAEFISMMEDFGERYYRVKMVENSDVTGLAASFYNYSINRKMMDGAVELNRLN